MSHDIPQLHGPVMCMMKRYYFNNLVFSSIVPLSLFLIAHSFSIMVTCDDVVMEQGTRKGVLLVTRSRDPWVE